MKKTDWEEVGEYLHERLDKIEDRIDTSDGEFHEFKEKVNRQILSLHDTINRSNEQHIDSLESLKSDLNLVEKSIQIGVMEAKLEKLRSRITPQP